MEKIKKGKLRILAVISLILSIFWGCSEKRKPPLFGLPAVFDNIMDIFPDWGLDTLIVYSHDGGFIDTDTIRLFAADTSFIYPTLFVIKPDGSGKRRIFDGIGDHPDISPDGKKIVFTLEFGDVAIMNIDGSDLKILVPYDCMHPEWSPDGKKILFMKKDETIWMINADSSNERYITEGKYPSWSPSGDRIVCVKDDKLVIIDTMGNVCKVLLKKPVSYPAWSPNGDEIAFSIWPYIYIIDTTGHNLRKLTTGRMPAWSPDGEKIVFSDITKRIIQGETIIYQESPLFIINADGTGRRQLIEYYLVFP